jgi:hypothetical protein
MFATIHLWKRRLERDPKAKAYTDEALRTTDDYDHQEMTSSPRPRAKQPRRPSGWRSTTTLTPRMRRRRR